MFFLEDAASEICARDFTASFETSIPVVPDIPRLERRDRAPTGQPSPRPHRGGASDAYDGGGYHICDRLYTRHLHAVARGSTSRQLPGCRRLSLFLFNNGRDLRRGTRCHPCHLFQDRQKTIRRNLRMKFRSCVSVCILVSFAVHAQESAHGLDDAFAAVEPKVIEWRRDIHQHPELGNR